VFPTCVSYLQDERTIGSEEAVYIESLKKDLEGVLAGLSDRDAGVLRMRFGLMDGREYTLDEVGAEFKVRPGRMRLRWAVVLGARDCPAGALQWRCGQLCMRWCFALCTGASASAGCVFCSRLGTLLTSHITAPSGLAGLYVLLQLQTACPRPALSWAPTCMLCCAAL
jgi:hypothetical protein